MQNSPKKSLKPQEPFAVPAAPMQKQWNQEKMKHRPEQPHMDQKDWTQEHWRQKEAQRKADIVSRARLPPKRKDDDGPVVRGPHGNVIPKELQKKFAEIQEKMEQAKEQTKEALKDPADIVEPQ